MISLFQYQPTTQNEDQRRENGLTVVSTKALLVLVDLNLTLLCRTRNEVIDGINHSYFVQENASESSALYYVYLRPHATELMCSLLRWQQAGLCQGAFYTQMTQEYAFHVAIGLLQIATNSTWQPMLHEHFSFLMSGGWDSIFLFDWFCTKQDVDAEEASKNGQEVDDKEKYREGSRLYTGLCICAWLEYNLEPSRQTLHYVVLAKRLCEMQPKSASTMAAP